MRGAGHRQMRGTTHHNGRRPTNTSSPVSGGATDEVESLPPLPDNALLIVACDQSIRYKLDQNTGAQPIGIVYVKDSPAGKSPGAYESFLVAEELALELCEKCYEELCQCNDKWSAPLVLARVTRGHLRRARPLHRTELPVEIPV